MNYRIDLPPKVRKELDALPDKFAKQIGSKIDALSENPRPPNSIKLQGQEAYRIKSGNYRVIYEIDDGAKIVSVLSVSDRKDAYKNR
jgi:mRNA interferase RelE/StbE